MSDNAPKPAQIDPSYEKGWREAMALAIRACKQAEWWGYLVGSPEGEMAAANCAAAISELTNPDPYYRYDPATLEELEELLK